MKKCGRAIGSAKPGTPKPVYAEDFSLVVDRKARDRLRVVRGKRFVLS